MRVARRSRNPWWMLAIVIFLGALLGSVIAEALAGYPVLSFLSRDLFYGIDPPFTHGRAPDSPAPPCHPPARRCAPAGPPPSPCPAR